MKQKNKMISEITVIKIKKRRQKPFDNPIGFTGRAKKSEASSLNIANVYSIGRQDEVSRPSSSSLAPS